LIDDYLTINFFPGTSDPTFFIIGSYTGGSLTTNYSTSTIANLGGLDGDFLMLFFRAQIVFSDLFCVIDLDYNFFASSKSGILATVCFIFIN
jgi:hypothetical protein